MNITGKKNLQKGEVAIYYPEIHRIYLIKPLLLAAAALVLFFTRGIIPRYIGLFAAIPVIYSIVVILFLAFSVVFLLWKLFAFYMVQYTITNKRLILRKGIFTSVLVDMPIDKVESVVCLQSLLGGLFSYGTIMVSGVGGMKPCYSTIRKPHKVRRIIYDIIDKNKNITITREDSPRPVLVKQVQKKPDIQYGTFVTSYPADERKAAGK
jgi:uncharacterized membrane protein YdbT with pleckstrin-like domain